MMFEQISFFDLIGNPGPASCPLRQGSQIKSKKRVKDHGEVFTAEREVKAMGGLIPAWSGNVLEPACGNGNFLVEIARRKLQIGMTPEEVASTIFGIDILPDNVQEARGRLLELLPGTEDILARNIVCGDFLRPETVWFLAEGREDT